MVAICRTWHNGTFKEAVAPTTGAKTRAECAGDSRAAQPCLQTSVHSRGRPTRVPTGAPRAFPRAPRARRGVMVPARRPLPKPTMVFLSHTAEPRGSRDLRDRKRELKPSRTHGRTWRAWATVGTNLRSSLAARDGPFCRRRACAHLGLTRRIVGPRRTPCPLGPRAGGSDPRPSASRRHGRVAASSFLSPRESSAPRVLTQAAGSCRASEPTRDTRLAPPSSAGPEPLRPCRELLPHGSFLTRTQSVTLL